MRCGASWRSSCRTFQRPPLTETPPELERWMVTCIASECTYFVSFIMGPWKMESSVTPVLCLSLANVGGSCWLLVDWMIFDRYWRFGAAWWITVCCVGCYIGRLLTWSSCRMHCCGQSLMPWWLRATRELCSIPPTWLVWCTSVRVCPGLLVFIVFCVKF